MMPVEISNDKRAELPAPTAVNGHRDLICGEFRGRRHLIPRWGDPSRSRLSGVQEDREVRVLRLEVRIRGSQSVASQRSWPVTCRFRCPFGSGIVGPHRVPAGDTDQLA
jgi:hypothetical protein